MQKPKQLINDRHFRVNIDLDGSSPAPERSIWRGQHVCVSENYAFDAIVPAEPAEAIIKHQLKVRHWSVLEFGYVVLHFDGFPHDTVMQLVRHQGSRPLVQSMRYTGQRMVDAAKWYKPEIIESLFYCQPAGEYTTRTGSYVISDHYRESFYRRCHQSCVDYALAIDEKIPEEAARRELKSGYRQSFTMAGSIRAVFHWLDQRTLSDTQLEAQTLAWMALDALKEWSPVLFEWYEKNRAGRNMLAP
jgi:flavin-dependent thymidylate synthase